MKVRFHERAIEFESYPFEPSPGKLAASDILDVDSTAAPPEVRTKAGDILFVSAEDKAGLAEFARRNAIPEVKRFDVWAAILEPFLATSFTDIDNERTLKLLEDHGVSRDQVTQLRAEFGPLMKDYNALHQDWVHLGLFDLFEALKDRDQLTKEIYDKAVDIARRAKADVRELYFIDENPKVGVLDILDKDRKPVVNVFKEPRAARVFLCILFAFACIGLGALSYRHLPLGNAGKSAMFICSCVIGLVGALLMQPKTRFDLRVAEQEHLVLRSVPNWKSRPRFELTTPDFQPIASVDGDRAALVVERAENKYRLLEKKTRNLAAEITFLLPGHFRLDVYSGDPKLYWCWAIILLC